MHCYGFWILMALVYKAGEIDVLRIEGECSMGRTQDVVGGPNSCGKLESKLQRTLNKNSYSIFSIFPCNILSLSSKCVHGQL